VSEVGGSDCIGFISRCRPRAHARKDSNQDGRLLREIIVEMKDGRKERTASQEATEANLENMEPNPGEKEAAA
jgi:hypothetical protein